MNRYDKNVPTLFAEEARFELEPRLDEHRDENRFSQLKDGLLGELITETETLALHKQFQHAAGEAAGLAWTTEFPLLLFPTLFDELVSKARLREAREQMIKARSATLLAEAV